MRNVKGRLAILAVLLCGLIHSWFGHTFVHDHHHEELSETSYVVSVRLDLDNTISELIPPVLLTGIVDFASMIDTRSFEFVELEEVRRPIPCLIGRINTGRAPPAFS